MGDGGRGEQDGTVDVPPDFVAAAFAQLDAALEVLQGMAWSPLSPAEVRACVRGLTSRQGRLESARFAGLRAIDARDDVVPLCRAGQAAVTFLQHSIGADHAAARRDVTAARLLDPDTGDLKEIGAAFAAGEVLRGHVEVAVRAHRDLGPAVREQIVPLDVNAQTGEVPEDSRIGRRIEEVDETLARHSRALDVGQVEAVARRIVEELNPKEPAGAHERRFLYASAAKDGSVVGKFACGATQGALILGVLAAGNAPRPGLGIDQDGVEHALPDRRDLGQRNIDARTACLAAGAARAGIPLPDGAGTRPEPEPWPDTFAQPQPPPKVDGTT
ncbi:MAG: hypothetical protein JO152_03825, partial [Mycobacteriaceae bacterium]|nr:hypothetical protein [Mycobacteriaceae bacterium]